MHIVKLPAADTLSSPAGDLPLGVVEEEEEEEGWDGSWVTA